MMRSIGSRPSKHRTIAWTIGAAIYIGATFAGAYSFTPTLDHFPPSPAMVQGQMAQQSH
ncbi:hypothetical protein ACVXZ4_08270 [Lacisediminihabitans sp. FW035]